MEQTDSYHPKVPGRSRPLLRNGLNDKVALMTATYGHSLRLQLLTQKLRGHPSQTTTPTATIDEIAQSFNMVSNFFFCGRPGGGVLALGIVSRVQPRSS